MESDKTAPDPRIAFFDALAETWDRSQDMDALADRLRAAFDGFGVRPSEAVLDVGCGTGNLTRALLVRLGCDGRVTALDVSEAMLARARRKAADARATWLLAKADAIPVADAAFDRVLCFSAWPHFDRPGAVVREFRRVLRFGGCAHVFHFISREAVNRIHSQAHDPSIRADLLIPVEELAALFERDGFSVLAALDTPERYALTARKEG